MQLEQRFPDGLLDHAVEIGAVTERSVRAWVRKPHAGHVEGTLSIDGERAAEASTALSEDSDWTGTLQFDLDMPAPGTEFQINVDGFVRRAVFAPTPGEPARLTFGFGSCNRPFQLEGDEIVYHQAAGIYDALQNDLVRADGRFVLLAGDQIYSDEIDPISVRSDHLDDEGWLPTPEETLDAYRQISRGYLHVSGFQRLRNGLPTLTIWDDHDIFDNWGSRREVSTLDRRMFDAASRAYYEYQHIRNPGPHAGQPPYHYAYQYGDIGFFVLDVRGQRDWRSGKILGDRQWKDLTDYLGNQSNERITTLFIVSSVPVAHVARWMARAFEHLPGVFGDSVRDRWSAAAYRDQRKRLLQLLFDWQAAAPGRQAIVLSGDVHVAGAYTIRPRSGPGRIEQFTSSAFTTPLSSFERYLNVIAARGSNLFESRWTFQRHFIDYSNNAGLVRLTPLESGGHHVELLIRGWNRRERRLRTVARLASTPGDR